MIVDEASAQLTLYSLLWVATLVVAVISTLWSRKRTVGLPVAFILATTVLHIGAIAHIDTSYDHTLNPYLVSWDYSRETVVLGVEVSLLAIVAFTVGCNVANFWGRDENRIGRPDPHLLFTGSKLILFVGSLTAALNLFLKQIELVIPGMGAVLGSAQSLIVLGCCGLYLHYSLLRNPRMMVFWGGLAVVILPTINALSDAILADSVPIAIAAIGFFAAVSRPGAYGSIRAVVVTIFAGYVLMLAGAAWTEARTSFRSAVFSGESLSTSLNVLAASISNVSFFDITSQTRLELLDIRMNHNVIIGKAVEKLEYSGWSYENGGTLVLAPIAWIPRVVWKGKPKRGGSDIVDKYTGRMKGNSRASLASGPIFEFFINFSYLGVGLGFLAYGILMRLLDIRASKMFRDGDIVAAAPFFLLSYPMVTTANTLFFIVNSAVSGCLVCLALLYYWRRRSRQMRRDIKVLRATTIAPGGIKPPRRSAFR